MPNERQRDIIDVDPREKCIDAQKTNDIWNATPGCDGRIVDNFYGGGGIKCTKCKGWFCF